MRIDRKPVQALLCSRDELRRSSRWAASQVRCLARPCNPILMSDRSSRSSMCLGDASQSGRLRPRMPEPSWPESFGCLPLGLICAVQHSSSRAYPITLPVPCRVDELQQSLVPPEGLSHGNWRRPAVHATRHHTAAAKHVPHCSARPRDDGPPTVGCAARPAAPALAAPASDAAATNGCALSNKRPAQIYARCSTCSDTSEQPSA